MITKFYVKSTGSDSNLGTYTSPFRTLHHAIFKACQTVVDDIIVLDDLVIDSTYPNYQNSTNSGRNLIPPSTTRGDISIYAAKMGISLTLETLGTCGFFLNTNGFKHINFEGFLLKVNDIDPNSSVMFSRNMSMRVKHCIIDNSSRVFDFIVSNTQYSEYYNIIFEDCYFFGPVMSSRNTNITVKNSFLSDSIINHNVLASGIGTYYGNTTFTDTTINEAIEALDGPYREPDIEEEDGPEPDPEPEEPDEPEEPEDPYIDFIAKLQYKDDLTWKYVSPDKYSDTEYVYGTELRIELTIVDKNIDVYDVSILGRYEKEGDSELPIDKNESHEDGTPPIYYTQPFTLTQLVPYIITSTVVYEGPEDPALIVMKLLSTREERFKLYISSSPNATNVNECTKIYSFSDADFSTEEQENTIKSKEWLAKNELNTPGYYYYYVTDTNLFGESELSDVIGRSVILENPKDIGAVPIITEVPGKVSIFAGFVGPEPINSTDRFYLLYAGNSKDATDNLEVEERFTTSSNVYTVDLDRVSLDKSDYPYPIPYTYWAFEGKERTDRYSIENTYYESGVSFPVYYEPTMTKPLLTVENFNEKAQSYDILLKSLGKSIQRIDIYSENSKLEKLHTYNITDPNFIPNASSKFILTGITDTLTNIRVRYNRGVLVEIDPNPIFTYDIRKPFRNPKVTYTDNRLVLTFTEPENHTWTKGTFIITKPDGKTRTVTLTKEELLNSSYTINPTIDAKTFTYTFSNLAIKQLGVYKIDLYPNYGDIVVDTIVSAEFDVVALPTITSTDNNGKKLISLRYLQNNVAIDALFTDFTNQINNKDWSNMRFSILTPYTHHAESDKVEVLYNREGNEVQHFHLFTGNWEPSEENNDFDDPYKIEGFNYLMRFYDFVEAGTYYFRVMPQYIDTEDGSNTTFYGNPLNIMVEVLLPNANNLNVESNTVMENYGIQFDYLAFDSKLRITWEPPATNNYSRFIVRYRLKTADSSKEYKYIYVPKSNTKTYTAISEVITESGWYEVNVAVCYVANAVDATETIVWFANNTDVLFREPIRQDLGNPFMFLGQVNDKYEQGTNFFNSYFGEPRTLTEEK